ncbi:hypothetical protein SAMD00023353_11400040 [Rosellinia necatrix]|uniref:Uncharacterized protein n=1 Tax=Rosellinia necatrix TaxID=77044 RepID=A0A1W2TX12_ROSNE|nr:hypothetical protein SAMD00023353_11400040 [Rosellinia necatrix]
MSPFLDQPHYEPRRSGAKVDELAQPWTTARCHRLLRPLISRIASLRKDTALASQSRASTPRPTSGTALISSAGGHSCHEEADVESGCLLPKKKRPRLTYSQRRRGRLSQPGSADWIHLGQGSSDENPGLAPEAKSGVRKAFKSIQVEGQRKVTTPGELVASTPILRRARGKIVLSPVAPVPDLDLSLGSAGLDRGHRTRTGSSAQKRPDERLASLRESLPSRYADLEAIYRSLEALLKATATSTVRASGPRSFLDICLRKVPQYIIELEAWERLDAEQSGTVSTLDDIDTSAQIYNELESLGTNIGWRHLRVVVRADGLNAVKQGIAESLFCDEFSQLLVDLCSHLGAVSEAEDLMAELVHRQYPQPTSTDCYFTQAAALQPLLALNSFASQTQRTPFLLSRYSTLLASNSLPVDWLATSEFERIWGLGIRGLASADTGRDAIRFIGQSIWLLCCRKRTFNGHADTKQPERDMAKASQRTLMSALGILASMSLLGETELNAPWLPKSDTLRIMIIGDRLRYIIRACIHELEGNGPGRGNQRLEFLYLALFLSSGHCEDGKIGAHVAKSIGKLLPPSVASLSSKDTRMRNHYDNVAWLIASIARACGRGTSVASHQCLDGLFKRLELLEIDQHLLDNLKAAAAFLIAQQTNNVRDLIYAESLHPHDRSTSGATNPQESEKTLFTGYRWEETIGEWVMTSPVLNKRRAYTKKRHLRSSTPAESTESLITQSSGSARLVADGVSDTETDPNPALGDSENSTDERIGQTFDGTNMMLMKKRPRRLRSTETPSANLTAKPPVPQKGLAIPAFPALLASQVVPGKENRVRLLAKRPRRSSGRIVLGARSPSHDSIGRRDNYGRHGVVSDDELCV